jgi:preprotein translocase subunit YajC
MPRYRSRVAAFVAFVVALSGTRITTAGELEGTVHTIDAMERTVTLDNGTKVWIGDAVAIEDLKEGAEVRVSYEERDGRNVATSVEKR